MLTQYFDAAMRTATYKLFDDGTYYGEIPGFEGVLANRPTLEACRDELRSALEGWVMLGLWFHDPMPVVDGIELAVRRVPDDVAVPDEADAAIAA